MTLLERARARATAKTSGPTAAARSRATAEEGFTLMIALGVMFVTSLMLVAAFAAANGDINLTHDDATQKQAYYAALAGVQEYEYHLQANPDYWETCAQPSNTVPNEASEHYAIKLLTASTAPKGTTECSKSNPFGTMIQAGGSEANTFRIESTGTAGKEGRSGFETRRIVATFRVVGFLNYAYFTQYETEDPTLYEGPKFCGENYRPKREELEKKFNEECQSITFYSADSVKGPTHTDDEAEVCSGGEGEQVTFGREGHSPPDVAEFNYGYINACSGKPKFNTATKNYTVGTELLPPEGDTSLATYVKEGGEGGDEFKGVTHIVLNGYENTMAVTTIQGGKEVKEPAVPWPKNGLVYVSSNGNCEYEFTPENSDNSTEKTKETNCGNVYVSGTYSQSLTIGAENDLIINGSVYPTSVAGKEGAEPGGTDTLGLIAGGFVRYYHPCSGGKNGAESLLNPWIYAALLSTNHSIIVDNFRCGTSLGKINLYGAMAQKFRGPVGTTGGTGYLKNYNYDERLAVDEPPYFLNPINAGWEVARETSPTGG